MRYNPIRQQISIGEVRVKNQAAMSSSDKILAAATRIAQAHGYSGLNVRALADEVGIKAASLYHHFPSKADLAAAVAKRYWEDSAAVLEAIAAETADPVACLRRYPLTFRISLENDNRMCLSSFMAAEYDDLPEGVQREVQAFADVNVAWLARMLVAGGIAAADVAAQRARAIFAAVAGAQLMARGRADIALFDDLIGTYQASGLLPA
jgi:TetR/AcrR family transcriptional repressor of nem operon